MTSTPIQAEIEAGYSFRSNPNLKKPGSQINFTPEQLQELVRCSQDPLYFIEKYVKIIHVDKGVINCELYEYQRRFIRLLHENRFVTARMARQAGKTTTLAAYFCWYLIFNDEKTCAILANKAMVAKEILHRVMFAYENLPLWLQQGVTAWNKGSMELENGSRILAAATSSSAIRGFSISFLFIDEVAFIPRNQWENFYNSVYATVTSGKETKIVMVSTPYGMNHFYEIHTKAEKGLSEFKAINVTWRQVPGRDEEWRRQTISNTSERAFLQEHEVQFQGSALTLLNAGCLSLLEAREPIRTGSDGRLKMYELPKEGHIYVLSADTGHGTEGDYSAFSVIDVTALPYRQVAMFRDNTIGPMIYSDILVFAARTYNEAFVLIETNDIGGETLKHVWQDLEYENVISTRQEEANMVIGKRRLGHRVSVRTKRIGCLRFKLMVENAQLEIYDEQTVKECVTFVRDPKKQGETYSAEEGHHDDLVMGLVNFCYLVSSEAFKGISEGGVRNALTWLRENAVDSLGLPPVFEREVYVEPEKVYPKKGLMPIAKGELGELDSEERAEFLR